MTVLSVDLPMTREGWANAREHFPCDACGVYVFQAVADRKQVPLRIGQAEILRTRLCDSSGSHYQAFMAPHVDDYKYTRKHPNYVSFFSQIASLAEQRFLTNTAVSLLALPMGTSERGLRRAQNEAIRELDPVWETKNREGRKLWAKTQWLESQPRLEVCVERWIERNARRNVDIESVLRQIEEGLSCEREGS